MVYGYGRRTGAARVLHAKWYMERYRRLGVKTERSGDPHRETKPSAHATTRTTRHDRSMGVIHFVSRANFNEMFPDVGHCVKRQKGPNVILGALCIVSRPKVEDGLSSTR